MTAATLTVPVNSLTLSRLFSVTQLSPTLQPQSDVVLSITLSSLCYSVKNTCTNPDLVPSQWSVLGSIDQVTFIDIGHFLGEQNPSLIPAIQFNTASGVHLYLCSDAKQKSELSRYWDSLVLFQKISHGNTTAPLSDSMQRISSMSVTDALSRTSDPHGSQLTLNGVVEQLRNFSTMSDRFKSKIIAMEAVIQTKAAKIQSIARQFRNLELKNTELLCQLNESQQRNIEIMERHSRSEQMHLKSLEKLSQLQYRLDDRAAILSEKHDVLNELQRRLDTTKKKSRHGTFFIYFIALPIFIGILTHYMMLLRGLGVDAFSLF
ncbi:hypothetical protein QVD99_003941 [Batrachochytrium dendrobatidis]|nr:hypothetical protein O5D80_002219 [Batrachochytrium dendrobatidis]KAK5669550.1 hypothetical protein QVD99_003941 [Batrachochytrium dendrobatidis]